jgi:hypothetical protein
MIRTILPMSLILAALAGCVGPSPLGSRDPGSADLPRASTSQKRPPDIYPENVTESSAHAMAQSLAAEIEFDSRQPAPRSADVPAK